MKSGKQSSEFLLALGVFAMMVIDGTNHVNIDPEMMKWAAGLAASYAIGRAAPKTAEAWKKKAGEES
jgi:hypothetical protein